MLLSLKGKGANAKQRVRGTMGDGKTLCSFSFCKTIVLPGVTIGDNVVIGAGSVVTRDIPSNKVAFGNPCRVFRDNV